MKYFIEDLALNFTFNLILFFTITGEFLISYVLGKFCYKGYDSKNMVMSVLGSAESPVRYIYNLWLMWLGIFFIVVSISYYYFIRRDFPILAVLIFFSVIVFAFGAGLISAIFSVNEKKEIITLSSKIHGISAAVGFMALLFYPLLDAIVSFKQNDFICGVLDIISFTLAIVFFIIFVIGEKEQFKDTIFGYQGLYQRLTLLFIYFPFIKSSIRVLIYKICIVLGLSSNVIKSIYEESSYVFLLMRIILK